MDNQFLRRLGLTKINKEEIYEIVVEEEKLRRMKFITIKLLHHYNLE